MNKLFNCFTALIIGLVLTGCGKKSNDPKPNPTPNPDPTPDVTATATIDRSTTYQTIEGFGFFGARDVWWGNENNLYSDAWAEQAIKDLGITVWRNELFPPSTDSVVQDADFNKQKKTIEGLKKIADANRVNLKYILTVWSPPADMKCATDVDGNPLTGVPAPGGTRNGGTFDPAKYVQYATYLKDGLQKYKDLGVNIYALSPQNEPLFTQSFNSCAYNATSYSNMIKNVIPSVKTQFPNVKIFGSENMLEIEAKDDSYLYFFHNGLKNDATAGNNIDFLAVHGYSDGVAATTGSTLVKLWTKHKERFANPMNKETWMTETSGYNESWTASDKPGALNLAMDIHSALYHGKVSAWVWWQGSSADNINEFSLMKGTDVKGKKYYVSKHFYRFIRPGAKMVKIDYDETKDVFVSGYENTAMGSFTMVLINNSDKIVKMNLSGSNIPADYDYYITTSGSDNCTKRDAKSTKDNIILPAKSVVTLVNGNVFE